ncbi:ribonuclease H-like domain-containing protein [Emericellopsis atlantica]|uniref:ribonuclease H n=1 Tax=Emericellopsis atlantica TaxID=2614577 RepID=A0A9P7ZLW7_9HYPO|nr:ribonuclease H-like domain-containing protein [Emericellopsis atlantica]KAG9254524.1 ribonuclease H-like domain-containing protein [Emericellopsis atlantica]
MPLGYYLAQGLIPLGPSSSDEEGGPCELPDGRIVCEPHGLDLMNEDDIASEQRDQRKPYVDRMVPRKGTGKVFFSKFNPPSPTDTPLDLFSGRRRWRTEFMRMTHDVDPWTGIVFTDGACFNNGQSNPKAAWAVHHGIFRNGQLVVDAGRLEMRGPFDDSIREQTSNRAELRAIIAALRFHEWADESFRTLVIATDSSYAVEGATTWCRTWLRNGWRTSQPGNPEVKNRDLWEALLGEAERAHELGLNIELWHIPRGLNTVADGAAKKVAVNYSAPEGWSEDFDAGINAEPYQFVLERHA